MKNILLCILTVLVATSISLIGVALEYSVLFAVSYMVCALANYFVGFELLGNAFAAVVAFCWLLIGTIRRGRD